MQTLQPLHTFGLHHKANRIERIIDDARSFDVPDDAIWLLGEGSNCVFVEDFRGTVILIQNRGVQFIEQGDHFLIKAKAGENWHQLVVNCLEKGIYGFENLALIPGTVGAAPIQNIGAYGVEVDRYIERVSFIELSSGQQHSLHKDECQFGYRDSLFKRELCNKVLITEVEFRLPKAWQPCLEYGELKTLTMPSAQQIFDKVIAIRQAKLPDPKKIGNAGSFFKNPVIGREHLESLQQNWSQMPHFVIGKSHAKVPAAWLIDQLGFKGQSCGGIQCHPSQPLVLTNKGGGTGEQLLELAREIRNSVKNTFAIELENEVRLVGERGLVDL